MHEKSHCVFCHAFEAVSTFYRERVVPNAILAWSRISEVSTKFLADALVFYDTHVHPTVVLIRWKVRDHTAAKISDNVSRGLLTAKLLIAKPFITQCPQSLSQGSNAWNLSADRGSRASYLRPIRLPRMREDLGLSRRYFPQLQNYRRLMETIRTLIGNRVLYQWNKPWKFSWLAVCWFKYHFDWWDCHHEWKPSKRRLDLTHD